MKLKAPRPQPPQKSAQPEIPIVRSPEFVSFYSSNVRFQLSVFDIRMTFGEGIPDQTGKVQIDEKATVVMSLQHAKVFSKVLAENISKYEEQVGEVKIPVPQALIEPVH